ncbi:MAG: MBL fold metallo-hydrolase [Candidatus Kerfeldbacteria bacterium]|nr:MBL fold metallo-hydrolase [Candidatus Kerfeldbacteria bacterium]
MKIAKLGHCCLVIEQGGLRILTDPGDYTTAQTGVRNIDAVLITHEHGDHLHLASLKIVLANNPGARVYTNSGVGEILKSEGLQYELLEDGQSAVIKGVTIEAHGAQHAPIHPSVKEVVNTGYLIAGRFFHPGDAFYNPDRPIEILALPVSAPWLKIAEALEYAQVIKPKVCFPVHDGALKIFGAPHKLPAAVLPPLGIGFKIPELGVAMEF